MLLIQAAYKFSLIRAVTLLIRTVRRAAAPWLACS